MGLSCREEDPPIRLPFALLLPITTSVSAAPAAKGDETSWYRIVAPDGVLVGHISQTTRAIPAGRERLSKQVLTVEGSGGAVTRIDEETRTVEDASGRPQSIVEEARVGRSRTRKETRIDGDRAVLTRTVGSDRRSRVLRLPQGIRFDSGAGLLKDWRPGMPPLAFDNLNSSAMTVERVVIEPAPPRAGDPPGGYAAIRKRYEGQELRGIARLTVDSAGRIATVTQPMFGTGVVIEAADRESALKPHPPLRLLRSSMVASPFRIAERAMKGHIRYRFAFREGLAFPIPATGEQRVVTEGQEALLDVCTGCGPGLSADADTRARALAPTAWLQSDHPRLRSIASPIARLKVTDQRKMEMLIEHARPFIERIDFVGHYSALETLDRRSGDCTEAAVLLAALARSAGIPALVANGIVYSRQRYHGVSNIFMPHSWVIAWADGAWRSFDLALGSFDSTHVALTVGDGDARSVLAAGQLASLLEWKTMAEVRRRPSS